MPKNISISKNSKIYSKIFDKIAHDTLFGSRIRLDCLTFHPFLLKFGKSVQKTQYNVQLNKQSFHYLTFIY